MNIVTVFSGRRSVLEILLQYLKQALALNIIDEVHLWNNTKNPDDFEYIKSISNLKRTSSSGAGNYIEIMPTIIHNTFTLTICASNDVHIKIMNIHTEYEIVLGGWKNTKSVVRKNGEQIYELAGSIPGDEFKFDLFIFKTTLGVYINDVTLFIIELDDPFIIDKIFFKTGHNSVGNIHFTAVKNTGVFLMDTCEKSWKNYYQWYDSTTYNNDIIIKCDDDIVFIDLHKLPKFIDYVKNTDCDLVFANIINNGVSSYFQQHKYNLIPESLMLLEYPPGGSCGSLWENGEKAKQLHHYFISNYLTFINHQYEETIPINSRFSINFFGYKGKNWHKITNCYIHDEYNLTVDYVNTCNFKNVLYPELYVSHLSFWSQALNHDFTDIIYKYMELCNHVIAK
jgi:hypothetical protein